MKRFLFLILTAAMLFSLSACELNMKTVEEIAGDLDAGDELDEFGNIIPNEATTELNIENKSLVILCEATNLTDYPGDNFLYACEANQANYSVSYAYTNESCISRIYESNKIMLDNITRAMDGLMLGGVGTTFILPTNIIEGKTYKETYSELTNYSRVFPVLKVAKPLLSSDADYAELAQILASNLEYNPSTAYVFIGFEETEDGSSDQYLKLEDSLRPIGRNDIFITTETYDLNLLCTKIMQNGTYTNIEFRPLTIYSDALDMSAISTMMNDVSEITKLQCGYNSIPLATYSGMDNMTDRRINETEQMEKQ